MGRRQRHFNPVHAGAGFALDARTLTFSNNASVTTWGSRPGASFSFSETSNYPTFLTSVSAAANQPGVNFVSGSQQRLVTTSVAIASSSDAFTIVEFSTSGNGFISFAQVGDGTRIGAYWAGSPPFNVVFHRGYFAWFNSGGSIQELSEGVSSNGVVAWARQSGTSQTSGINNTQMSSRTSSGVLRGTASSAPPNDYRTGVLHSLSVFNAAISAPLLRRIVNHYAYSYKNPN